jgi:Carboxypeptidase regulatory-like domain
MSSDSSALAGAGALAGGQALGQQSTGSISGTVVDQKGEPLSGVHLTLARADRSPKQETLTDDGGQFFFVNEPPGAFRLTVTLNGFATQTVSGSLDAGQAYIAQRVVLAVAEVRTEVNVVLPQTEVAEEQVKVEESQRVLGFVPNFYVAYMAHPVPLDTKQKFELAWKSTMDPVNFAIVGGLAGVQQADNQFSGYGQGAQGYAKRFGSSFADQAIGTFIGGAILPSVLRQDPRYFFKGSGTKRSRILYAIATSVICKGDNGHWQPDYSGILGDLAAGGISYLYYPPQNRNGVALTFESTAIGIGASAGANLLQEFVVPKLMLKKPSSSHSGKP